jgi:hypothetical protein
MLKDLIDVMMIKTAEALNKLVYRRSGPKTQIWTVELPQDQ